MRPRVFPAEDCGALAADPIRVEASMRPRVFPAEDDATTPPRVVAAVASMRPRVFPAEDSAGGAGTAGTGAGFNEAAGIPRGRL